jgi:hypothetical protein
MLYIFFKNYLQKLNRIQLKQIILKKKYEKIINNLNDKITTDRKTTDKKTTDKITTDKITTDKITTDKITTDKKTIDYIF